MPILLSMLALLATLAIVGDNFVVYWLTHWYRLCREETAASGSNTAITSHVPLPIVRGTDGERVWRELTEKKKKVEKYGNVTISTATISYRCCYRYE